MEWIKQVFSDPKGTPDDARIAAFILVLTYCGAAVYALYKGQTWNPQEFGIGAGALVAGVGVLFGQRKEH